jgi:superfamily II DNA or RNA helicase
VDLTKYYERYGSLITQESERLFLEEFLWPLLGEKIGEVIPQCSFIDSTGRNRRIDFSYRGPSGKLAFEVDGESFHSELFVPREKFDEDLFRQNELLRLGYKLIRFSYTQLQEPTWRPIVAEGLRDFIGSHAPELVSGYHLRPLPVQEEVLHALDFYREHRTWQKGIVVLPTGTGKTVLSALDARRVGPPVLFLVHRLDILKQSVDAYRLAWPDMRVGVLTGEVRENERDCDVLFASKDTLRRPSELNRFHPASFNYIVVDEVHHGQSPTYREVLTYFRPTFMLGMTATPDRMDRRDIFELFDYNKVFELSVQDAIEQGYLVPYTYYGLRDDIDYSQIRYENQRYRVADLERLLIIPERNEAIVSEYLERGQGDKAIGFCVSIRHAERMAEVFQAHGISAAAIHSDSSDRDELIEDFRQNRYQIVFTVDLFNEGVDFPNVQVLLFLRPTESKTVFLQQLGRGLRLSVGKERIRILDFIGNYQRANQVRKYLSSSSSVVEVQENGRRRRKVEYAYSTDCEVFFDPEVEEMLNRQDAEELGITKDDLKEAYFALAETLGRKPTRADLDREGEHPSGHYVRLFGSWRVFLREVGEYTEASYHYPQGVHLGHVLSILQVFAAGARDGTHFDDEYVRLRGSLGTGRLSNYRRQVKYKLQAAMELGILTDDRNYPEGAEYTLELTPLGLELHEALAPVLRRFDLSFPPGGEGVPSTTMRNQDRDYNAAIREQIRANDVDKEIVLRVFLRMHAVQQMLAFLYHITRTKIVRRSEIYEQFFEAPFVREYCDQEGIEEASIEAARRRCPFLLNILDACDIVDAGRDEITVRKLVLMPSLVRPHRREDHERSVARAEAVAAAWPNSPEDLSDEDLSIVRELFGPAILTPEYHLDELSMITDS